MDKPTPPSQSKETANLKPLTRPWFRKNWVGVFIICLGLVALVSHLNLAEAEKNPEGLLGALIFIALGLWYLIQKYRGL